MADRMSLSEFVATRCTGREYDSCINSPCRYASASGCQHPEHPKRPNQSSEGSNG